MWRCIQHRLTQLGQAPALDGVQVKYCTGSVKHSSIVWSTGEVLHRECQTFQYSTCTSYPVPAEEAHEDAGAEKILFHIYKYKV